MIDRAFRVLEEIANAEPPVFPADLVRRLDIPKPTLHRILRALEEMGQIARGADGRSLGPGPRAVTLASATLRARLSGGAVRAVLEALSRDVEETCNLVALDGERMRYVERVEADWPLRLSFGIGQRVPMHCTATGKMVLAAQTRRTREKLVAALSLDALTGRTITDRAALTEELERTRARGYAVDDEEFLKGMVAVAVPAPIGPGAAAAAVSIHAPTARRTLDDLRDRLPRLREAAAAIAAAARA
jgi:DNA-binding IclR family transcriptional regulator